MTTRGVCLRCTPLHSAPEPCVAQSGSYYDRLWIGTCVNRRNRTCLSTKSSSQMQCVDYAAHRAPPCGLVRGAGQVRNGTIGCGPRGRCKGSLSSALRAAACLPDHNARTASGLWACSRLCRTRCCLFAGSSGFLGGLDGHLEERSPRNLVVPGKRRLARRQTHAP